jgi:hypothetical protein
MTSDRAPRPLTDEERTLARWMLERGTAEAASFLRQLECARVGAWRCPCGCASIDFEIEGRSAPREQGMRILGDYAFGDGDAMGAFIYACGGALAGIEVVGYAGDAPATLPSPEELRPLPIAEPEPPPRRPLLLRFAPIYFGGWGGGMCIGFPLALFDVGSFSINGEPVSGPEFAARVYPAALPLAVAAVVLAWGFHRQRPWTRKATLVLLAAVVVGSALVGLVSGAVVHALMISLFGPVQLAVIAWYFYRKRNVVAYYRSIEARAAAPRTLS